MWGGVETLSPPVRIASDEWRRLAEVCAQDAISSNLSQRYAAYQDDLHPTLVSSMRNAVEKGQRSIIWVNGDAGSGKSFSAYALADELRRKELLAATFFFSRDSTKGHNLNVVYPTIAYQLGLLHLAVRGAIEHAIAYDPALLLTGKSSDTQLEELVMKPLAALTEVWHEKKGISMVLDGVEEVGSVSEQVAPLVLSLARLVKNPTVPIHHIVITSRLSDEMSAVMRQSQIADLLEVITIKDPNPQQPTFDSPPPYRPRPVEAPFVPNYSSNTDVPSDSERPSLADDPSGPAFSSDVHHTINTTLVPSPSLTLPPDTSALPSPPPTPRSSSATHESSNSSALHISPSSHLHTPFMSSTTNTAHTPTPPSDIPSTVDPPESTHQSSRHSQAAPSEPTSPTLPVMIDSPDSPPSLNPQPVSDAHPSPALPLTTFTQSSSTTSLSLPPAQKSSPKTANSLLEIERQPSRTANSQTEPALERKETDPSPPTVHDEPQAAILQAAREKVRIAVAPERGKRRSSTQSSRRNGSQDSDVPFNRNDTGPPGPPGSGDGHNNGGNDGWRPSQDGRCPPSSNPDGSHAHESESGSHGEKVSWWKKLCCC